MTQRREGFIEFQPVVVEGPPPGPPCLVCERPFVGDGYRVTNLSPFMLAVLKPHLVDDERAGFCCEDCFDGFKQFFGEMSARAGWEAAQVAVCGICGEPIMEGQPIDSDFDVHGACRDRQKALPV